MYISCQHPGNIGQCGASEVPQGYSHESALQIAEKPSEMAYNPSTLEGKAGGSQIGGQPKLHSLQK